MNGIGLDTETSGIDVHHGARPYLITISDEQYNNTHWEWDVEPTTRKVKVPKQDVEEIAHAILKAEYVVGQNVKFDLGMLNPIMPKGFKWPYEVIHDTTYSAHLIASNQAKDLTSLALDYLDIDIRQYEDELETASNKCRNLVRRKNSPIGDWLIAKKGLACMPSAKDKCWKYDMWLPKAVAKWAKLGTPKERSDKLKWLGVPAATLLSWEGLVATYANCDSASCLAIFLKHKQILEERNQWMFYEEGRKLIGCIVDMEREGATLSHTRYKEKRPEFEAINQNTSNVCTNIANSYGLELKMPKGGKNNSLTELVFSPKGLAIEPVQIGKKKTKTNVPSLDKNHLQYYIDTSPQRSKRLRFLENLSNKRASDTALSYMDSYEKFWLPIENEFCSIHSSLNVTGSNTLRFTSQNPNEQQISKREGFNLRYLFGPATGREWWSLDAKNIELRIPAYEAGETELIELFEKPDEPPYYGSNHLFNFSTIYPEIWADELKVVGIEKVAKHCKSKYEASWYQWCKNFQFSQQYGSMDRDDGQGTADIAAHKPGAQKLVKSRLTNIAKLSDYWIKYAIDNGYVETMPDKTINSKHGYPLVCTRNSWGKIKPTVPLAYHVSGTAGWWMRRAMVRCREQLMQWNGDVFYGPPHKADRNCYKMILQIHDELVFDLPAGKGKEPWKTNLPKIKALAKLMEIGGTNIGVPTPVGIEYHPKCFSESLVLA